MADIRVNEYWTARPVRRGRKRIRELTSLLNDRGYIAGSFAAWACTLSPKPWKPQDIDLFTKSDDGAMCVVEELCSHHGYFIDTSNEIVRTLRPLSMKGLNIQVVRPSPEWTTFPDDMINSFDLDVCRAVIISPHEVLCDLSAGTFSGKVLRINNPLRTFKRIMKYQARGVSFMDHELLKVFRAWDEMPAEKKAAWIKEAADELLPAIFDSSSTDEDDWFEGE